LTFIITETLLKVDKVNKYNIILIAIEHLKLFSHKKLTQTLKTRDLNLVILHLNVLNNHIVNFYVSINLNTC